jgi:beta-glucanase (GH16 family)
MMAAGVAAAACTVFGAPWHDAQAEPNRIPAAPVGFTPGNSYRLVKNWDFRGAIRDLATLREEFHTRYLYAGGTLDHLNDEWSRYRDHDNHVFTPGGLALVARLPQGAAGGATRPPVQGAIESGMLRSRWSGEYGVFEVRMKVPAGHGMWPAFWLNPQDGKWPPEIDVVEIVNNGRDTTKQSFHFLHPDGVPARPGEPGVAASKLDEHQVYRPGVDYADGFHVFAVEWSKDRVRHLVDGVVVADRAYRWVHEDGSDGGPAHLLVNLAVGGKWPGPPANETFFPAMLEIDYIRVWQR